ncbi:hypothetical protein B0H10DRAFT_2189124 [Mycena sp. CBHHK59/15]|nr:hypothetical protein B0H10DRAFT_2198796 [Mycena sp. CBHHK59/15]KAJ6619287.1 hypothetical protein B0H10DRAFT_2189124 [Mycena sp. CBHHK59/15]
MPICADCSIDFHGLTTDVCNKCQVLGGKSEIEKISIRAKGQCLACSLVYGQLQDALCNSCCHLYASADSVPRQIFDLPGANEQIINHQTSDFTSELWETVQGYKQTASDHRLGVPRVQNASLKKTSSGKAGLKLQKAAPGISKGQTT